MVFVVLWGWLDHLGLLVEVDLVYDLQDGRRAPAAGAESERALIRYQVRYELRYVKGIDNDLITTRYQAR